MVGMNLSFTEILTTFLIGICTLLLLYLYGTRNHDYWKKRGIPYVKPLPFLGTVLELFRQPTHEVLLRRYKQLGPLYGNFEGNQPALSVADPKLLRDILVKDFSFFSNRRDFTTGNKVVDNMVSILRDDDWKRIRNIITPAFTTGRIKRMLLIFKDCANTLVQNFKSEIGKPLDVKRLYGAFTMDVIASSAFSTKIDSHNDPNNEFVKTANKLFSRKFKWSFVLFFVAPRLARFLNITVIDSGPIDFFMNVTRQIVEERRRTGQGRNDFLQLLMDTAKEVGEEHTLNSSENEKEDIAINYGEESSGHSQFKNITSKHLSMNELVAQCVLFFIGGFDTTASTLSFASYLLAINPDIQDKLREEIDKALQETNGELTYDGVRDLKYMDNVISETLRIFPPAAILERSAEEDYKLGDTGLTVPKGMVINIAVPALQMDSKFFPDPERFNPDRFNAEERAKRDQYTYLPFGAGLRNCIGMRFVLMEIKVCLAHVISNFTIKRCPETKVPLEFTAGQGLLQPKELLVELELRQNNQLVK